MRHFEMGLTVFPTTRASSCALCARRTTMKKKVKMAQEKLAQWSKNKESDQQEASTSNQFEYWIIRTKLLMIRRTNPQADMTRVAGPRQRWIIRTRKILLLMLVMLLVIMVLAMQEVTAPSEEQRYINKRVAYF